MILGAISQSIGIGRLDYLEIPHSWFHARIAFLIPMPDVLLNNVDAVIKPFQKWVHTFPTPYLYSRLIPKRPISTKLQSQF